MKIKNLLIRSITTSALVIIASSLFSQAPVANFTISPNPACQNAKVFIKDLSTNSPTAWSYTLTGGNPAMSSIQNPTVTYNVGSSMQVFTITLIASNSSGTSTPVSQTLAVVPNPTVWATPNTSTICPGNPTTLMANSTYTPVNYLWNTGSTNSVIIVSPTITTTYSFTATNFAGCTGTNVSIVYVKNAPFMSAISSSSMLCVGQCAQLTASTSASTYTWSTGSSSMIVSVCPTVTTTYTLTGTGSNSCIAQTTITQSVSTCSGIQQLNSQDLSADIYPNPNNGEFNINVSWFSDKAFVTIYNSFGQLILKEKVNGPNHSVSLKSAAAGSYHLIIFDNNQPVYKTKFIKN